MAQLSSVVRFIRTIKNTDEDSDESLLARFASTGDELAFASLVKRHGPMVMSVCRRILLDYHQAEDAAQATFFVLARKASSIQRRQALSSWLYGVATRIALKARTAGKRLPHCLPQTEPLAPEAGQEFVWNELRPVLDEEICRLPEKYRAPFVLCYLQSKTNAAAALDLGCPEGTVVTRLARGRARLRERLSRRGVTLTLAGLGAAINQYARPAAVSAGTIQSLATKALGIGVGFSVNLCAAPSILLGKGILKTMLTSKAKNAAILVTTFVAIAGGAAGYQKLVAGEGDDQSKIQQAGQTAASASQSPKQLPATYPPPPSGAIAVPPPTPGGFVAGNLKQDENDKGFAITTFFTPVFEGGAVGQPVPFTMVIKDCPKEYAAKVLAQVSMPFQMEMAGSRKLTDTQKLDKILARLADLEDRMNRQGPKPGPNDPKAP